ncbi:MAG: 3'-5' exonuclease, partial [Actinomycetota bacterium]
IPPRPTVAAVNPHVPSAAKAEVEPDEVAYSLWEALDRLEEVAQPDQETGTVRLGPQAVSRLQRARREIAALRRRSGEPLPDLVQAVVREAGIAEALETLGPGALVNITGFLGVVASFAPISGDPSLPAFLAYLDAAEEVEETLEVGTPSAVESVKLMTVHQAKGLEFNVVFVPGVAARMNDKGDRVDSIFPDERTSNPMTSYGQLPHSVREDADHLPNPWLPDGRPRKKAELAKELRERAVEDERRLFYVALTRARQRLYVTAAWWYQRQVKPRGPSVFFEEVASDPETEVLPADAMPEESPLLERLGELAVWPPHPPHRLRMDDLFPGGYPAALDSLLAGEVAPASYLDRLDPAARARAELLLAEHRTVAAALAGDATDGRRSGEGAALRSVSATQLAGLLAKRVKAEDVLRPLPHRPSEAARVGVEIHRWIEEQARGLTGLADEEALDAPSVPLEAARIGEMKERFATMGFAGRTLARLDSGEPMAELPFTLKIGGRVVRGRIDAVYETSEGGLEIVDFKSGRVPAGRDEAGVDQLAIYAAALRKLGVAAPQGPAGASEGRVGASEGRVGASEGRVSAARPVRVTYAYLADGTLESREIAPAEVDAALAAMGAGLAR